MFVRKKHTVGKKLFESFTILIVLSLVTGFIGYLASTRIANKLDSIFSVRLPSVDYLLQTDINLQRVVSAERTLILTEVGSELYDEVRADYEERLKEAQAQWEMYKALPATPEQKAIFPLYEEALEKYKTSSGKAIYGMLIGTDVARANALSISLGEAKDDFDTMRSYLDKLADITLSLAENENETANSTYRTSRNWIFSITGFVFLIGVFFIWLNSATIEKPLIRAIAVLKEGADQVSAASNQITEASQSLASGASQQAASIEETSSSLEEISQMIRKSSENSKQADGLMAEAKEITAQANGYMEQMNISMKDIIKASEETSKIVKTIDEIAFQTNLLALNAAVEAARAGDAGAGFAVVADEVRSLALRAAEAAKNTEELIEATVKKVDSGADLTETTRMEFMKVTDSAAKVAELIGEIAAASNEQARGIGMITDVVDEMNKVTQQTAASSEESASSCEEMDSQAQMMKKMVGRLTVMIGEKNVGKLISKSDYAKRDVNEDMNEPMETMASEKTRKTRLPKARQEVRPDQVIPMDDDFQDF